jgi:hypothetical protein
MSGVRTNSFEDNTANAHQGFIVFCGLQAFLHNRESRRGAISLS